MKKKLVIDDAIPFLKGRIEHLFECEYVSGPEICRERLLDANGLLVRTRTQCGAPLLEGTTVSFVATGTIGLDHFDTEWLDSHNICWQNAPGCNAPGVAQYVWSALLRLGFDPKRRGANRLGIVGKGNVGSIVAEWGRRLGAEVLVCDPPRAERGLTDEAYMTLREMAAQVDAMTFHTPLTRSGRHATLHMAGLETLGAMRRGAIVINAARGGVVDEEALRNARDMLDLRIALDTWEGEPSISALTLDIADIATPHIAGYSRQGKQRATYAIICGLEKHFGVEISKEGLAAPYSPPRHLDEEAVVSSFDPMPLDARLRHDRVHFEEQRESYIFRDELL